MRCMLSETGTPALMRNERRFAKSVWSLTEKRTNRAEKLSKTGCFKRDPLSGARFGAAFACGGAAFFFLKGLFIDGSQYLGYRRLSCERFLKAVFKHRRHAVLYRYLLYRGG